MIDDPDVDGLPPQDMDAEQAILGSIFLQGMVALEDVALIIRASDFYRAAHQHIYQAAMDLYRDGEEIDTITIGSLLKANGRLDGCGGLDYLDRLQRLGTQSINPEAYARTVHDCARKRDLLWASHKIREMAQSGQKPDDAVSGAIEMLNEIAAAQSQTRDDWRGDSLIEACDKEIEGYCEPIPTGFPTLDKILGGGWVRKQVHILTARPGEGKSALICKFMISAIKAGKVPGIISREMSRNEVVSRLISLKTDIWLSSMHPRQDFYDEDEKRRFHEARRWIAERCVISHDRKVTVQDMDRILHRMVVREKCDILFVDLLDRISGDGTSDVEKLNSINKRLQDIADPDDLGVPVILVQQQNEKQNPYPAAPALSFTKGTGETVDNSSVVIGLLREKNDPGDASKGKLYVLKNRGAQEWPNGFAIEGDWRHLSWDEIEPVGQRKGWRSEDDVYDEG